MDWLRGFKDIVYLGLESMGRYYSCYRGYVADREDPQNYNRLRLIIPQVSGTNVYDYWAFPKGIDSGKGTDGKIYGTQFIPQKGDLVWVEFEGGHPSKPIWSLGYRGKGEVPTEADATDYDCYWFITPKGHVIKINDTKNYIHIKTQQGDYVELNSNSISLVTGKKISLGTLDNSAEPAVLGNKNVDVHNDVQDVLEKLTTALQKDVIASTTTGSPFLKYTNLQTAITQLQIKAKDIKPKIDPTKSKKVTLD